MVITCSTQTINGNNDEAHTAGSLSQERTGVVGGIYYPWPFSDSNMVDSFRRIRWVWALRTPIDSLHFPTTGTCRVISIAFTQRHRDVLIALNWQISVLEAISILTTMQIYLNIDGLNFANSSARKRKTDSPLRVTYTWFTARSAASNNLAVAIVEATAFVVVSATGHHIYRLRLIPNLKTARRCVIRALEIPSYFAALRYACSLTAVPEAFPLIRLERKPIVPESVPGSLSWPPSKYAE